MAERKMAHELIVGGVFTIPAYAMSSARPPKSDEWKIAIGKSGNIWLHHPEKSSVWVSGGKGSRGCGGSSIPFTLADGLGCIELVGPWHSNADAFFKDTGIDVRENFVTWGCIGTGREYNENTHTDRITGVLWFDPEPAKGLFDRVNLLAWEMQEKNPEQKLYYYCESNGGSSHGPVGMPYRVRVERGLQKPIDF